MTRDEALEMATEFHTEWSRQTMTPERAREKLADLLLAAEARGRALNRPDLDALQRIAEGAVTYSSGETTVRVVNSADLHALDRLIQEAEARGREAEREACLADCQAELDEEAFVEPATPAARTHSDGVMKGARHCINRIRARGESACACPSDAPEPVCSACTGERGTT